MDVPLGASSPSNIHDDLVDQEEATFSMDKEASPDKDTQLFNIADNLIKGQLARIDVPLLGVLSFDESDSESDEDDMEEYEEDEGEEDEDYEQPDDRDQDYGRDNGGDRPGETKCEPGMGSEEVQLGTGQGSGSRKRTSSLIS